MVLIIVMAITVVSIGFISKTNVELACGENMTLRTETDHLAESAIHHARGLILNPQDAATEYWTGANALQLAAGSDDYYDVDVARDDTIATNRCNYNIACRSYRLVAGEILGRSRLSAEVRLDPCIAFWTGADTTAWTGITVNGDVYCNGVLTNNGVINGDVFAGALTGGGSRTGQSKAPAELSLQWPSLDTGDFGPVYYIGPTAYGARIIASGTYRDLYWGPSAGNPAGVCYCSGDLELQDKVRIDGMLVVGGNLSVIDNNNVITAQKNFPALLVGGKLVVTKDHGVLQINGLAVVNEQVHVNVDSDGFAVSGGLFVLDTIGKTIRDESGNCNNGIVYTSLLWDRPGRVGNCVEFDGSSDYILVPNSSGLQLYNRLTVAAWIKTNSMASGSTSNAIVRKGRLNPNNYEFVIADSRVALMLDDGDTGGIRGDTPLETARWYHVAASWDGFYVRIYVDAVLDNSPPDVRGGWIGTDTRPLYIGGRPGGDYFNGLIDDIQIYNCALSQAEINDIKGGATKAGLVARWKLDERNNGGNMVVTAFPDKAAIQVWPSANNRLRWSPAAGAFFKTVARQ